MTGTPTRVLCVDDHAFLVEGLKARISVEPDLEFVGWLRNADDLVDEVDRTRADIVLIDIEMPGTDAFTAMDRLRNRHPNVRTIVLSAYVRDQYIDAAYTCGAWGYLHKSDSPDAVIEGIRKVRGGEVAYCPDVVSRTLPLKRVRGERTPVTSKLNLLTPREREILRLIAQGLSRTEIARQVSRSPMTIDNHRKSIMRKLDIRDRVELVRYAIGEGLVEV